MNIVSRSFLSDPDSSTSSSIYCFHGIPDYGGFPESFVEISDCRSKIKIHRQVEESLENYIKRLKKLKIILEGHIDILENLS